MHCYEFISCTINFFFKRLPSWIGSTQGCQMTLILENAYLIRWNAQPFFQNKYQGTIVLFNGKIGCGKSPQLQSKGGACQQVSPCPTLTNVPYHRNVLFLGTGFGSIGKH